jgi:hypothetical protein
MFLKIKSWWLCCQFFFMGHLVIVSFGVVSLYKFIIIKKILNRLFYNKKVLFLFRNKAMVLYEKEKGGGGDR